MNTQENNKLIAEFMQSIEDGLYLDGLYFYKGRYYDTNMAFHKSWDWLMPVVEKIENLGYEFFIVEDRIKIAHNTDHSTEIIINFTLGRNYGSKREAVYQGVVEFINEYNKNK